MSQKRPKTLRALGLSSALLGTLWLGSCSSDSGDDDSSDAGESGEAGTSSGKGGSAGKSGATAGTRASGGSDAGGAGASGADAGSAGNAGADGDITAGPDEAVQELGENGGELRAGYAELIVPPGALSEPTEITLRRIPSDGHVLDDVYELRPSGLVFLEPARFILQVGEELAADASELERRVVAYVDDPELPRPLPSNVRLASAGVFVGAVWHFSDVSTPVPGEIVPSPHFTDVEGAIPYGVMGSCTDFAKNFLPPEPGEPEHAAAETSVVCDPSGAIFVTAPPQGNKVCVSIAVPPAARVADVSMLYPSWIDPPSSCEEEWDNFQDRLATHEKLHRDIGLSGCESAFDVVGSSPPIACGSTEKAAGKKAAKAFAKQFSEALDSTRAAQASIDVGENHGVTMNCDCECDDKCQRMDMQTEMCVPIECDGECDKCVDGECVPDVCEECVPASESECPAGSTWDAGTETCVIDCTGGGSIAGLPCSFTGTSTAVNTAGGFSNSATVTLRADRFDGCAVLYEPVTGTVTSESPAPECTYVPGSMAVEQADTTCTFFVMPGETPYLVADCGSIWDGTIQCEDASAPASIGGLWLYTINENMGAGQDFTGSYSVLGGWEVTYAFTPE